MCASTANRRSPSSQDRPHSFAFIRGGSMASHKNPLKVSLRSFPASGAAACGDYSVFSSTANCELSTVNWFAHFALRYLVSFHTNTNCPTCNSFVLITMQIARGWGYLLGGHESRVTSVVHVLLFLFSTVSCELSALGLTKFFRMRSSAISTVKPFRMRSCKNAPA